MNINEKYQKLQLESFIAQSNKNNDTGCVFFGANLVDVASEPYDVKVSFENKIKYVQLTQMSSVVAKLNHKDVDPNQMKLNTIIPQTTKDERKVKKQIDKLAEMGIERKIIKSNSTKIFISDSFKSHLEEEINYEGVGSQFGGILNGLIRSLKSKLNKYDISKKEQNSCLVILDTSNSVFYRRPIVNTAFLKHIGSSKEEVDSYTINDFLRSILFEAIKIVKAEVSNSNFFNEIQVYFRQSQSTDSEEAFMRVSTTEINKFPFGHAMHWQYVVVAMNSVNKMSVIIPNENK